MPLFFIYRILVYCLIPAFLIGLWLKGSKNPAYRHYIHERFGFGKNPKPAYDLWIHAVSVGEVRAIDPLIKRLANTHTILVTVTTPTGRETANSLFAELADIRYLPYDIGYCVRHFLNAAKPKQAIVAETEVWPNLINNTKKREIPLAYVNVRLSDRSFKRYQKVRRFSRFVFNQIDIIAAQSQSDADRLKTLGVDDDKIEVTGSMKFDLQMPLNIQEKAETFRQTLETQRSIWICGSTRDGEEQQLIAVYQHLKKTNPDLLLVIVPRHPERFDEVAKLCHDMGLNLVRRTDNSTSIQQQVDVYLGDTLGELGLLYAASDVAFVGGSLMPLGGQNILEPCALGVPVLFGPHMFNFEEISQIVSQAGAGICVEDQQDLEKKLNELLHDSAKREAMSTQGLTLIDQHKGALDKIIALLN